MLVFQRLKYKHTSSIGGLTERSLFYSFLMNGDLHDVDGGLVDGDINWNGVNREEVLFGVKEELIDVVLLEDGVASMC